MIQKKNIYVIKRDRLDLFYNTTYTNYAIKRIIGVRQKTNIIMIRYESEMSVTKIFNINSIRSDLPSHLTYKFVTQHPHSLFQYVQFTIKSRGRYPTNHISLAL